MDWELVAKIIGAVGAMLVAWRAVVDHALRRRDLELLQRSLAIFRAIPEGWESKDAVRARVEADLHKLFHPDGVVALEADRRRAYDATLGALLILCTIVLFLTGSAWSLLTGMIGAGALMSGTEGARKAVPATTRPQGEQR